MKSIPIRPAPTERGPAGAHLLPGFVGAPADAALGGVFFAGNDLPARWRDRDGFTIVQAGFGQGTDFLATWNAWRLDPQRSARLSFMSVEPHPPSREALQAAHCDSTVRELVDLLVAAWPPLTPDLHRLAFDDGRVELLLAFGAAGDWLPELELTADAFYLDGPAATGDAQRSAARVCKALGRLARPEATLVARGVATAFRYDLAGAGFELRPASGIDDTPGLTLGHFRPRYRARPPIGRRASRSPSSERRALIVGGGLAGTAAAWALAERGWCSVIFDRQPGLAAEASGNPAGLFHGTVHAQDSPHARFSRAAALAVGREVASAIATHDVDGAVDGFLRLETALSLPAMQALLDRLGLSVSYVQALGADAASALAGCRLARPAWHYPGGGWVDPAGLARAYASRAGERLSVRTGTPVDAIRSVAGRWQVLGAWGEVLDEADTLVLANAGDALRLLGATGWPVEALRGQLSTLTRSRMPAALAACRLPIAAGGYLVPTRASFVFGATRQQADDDRAVRLADHAENLTRLETLVGTPLGIDPAALSGRTAWRWTSADRLPLVGPVPSLDLLQGTRSAVPRGEQPRHVPREPGLFVFIALGARGITASALGAQVLAAQVTGTPVPLAASLLDAIDPARFFSRALRQRAAADSRPSQVVG